ncbi:MAG: SAM-dependent DNA methyltransferase [Ignavibacteriae bacterium]|nr:SAM-dependent DNA methyltransferase [Ignavibacteriota bacterium]
MEIDLNTKLKKLDLISEDETNNGFYFTNEKDNLKEKPHIYFALEKAIKYDVDAVFFRLFDSTRPPIPQIYVYDYTNKSFHEQEFTIKHKKIWNSNQVPLIYVFRETDILIFNSYSPKVDNEFTYTFYQKISLATNIDIKLKQKNDILIRDFSARNIANGTFWDNEKYRNDFRIKNGVSEKLISNLINIRTKLIFDERVYKNKINDIEKKAIIHKLLITTILIKYLEEKKDEDNNTVFKEEFFKKYQKDAKSFIDVLNYNGDIIQLFDDLSEKFNGEIFKLENIEKELIKKINLKFFAEFFEGKTDDNDQLTLWRLYSFNDLPVELISNIYEVFLHDLNKNDKANKNGNKYGIFYTPPFLVDFLVEQILPISKVDTNIDCKILDPACGSGIFLVQAFKRLIFRWKIKNNWQKPIFNDLKTLLSNSIYGVDIKEDAIRLTIFSLTLAICEELNPIEIWENLKLENLKSNLFSKDFFELIEYKKLPNDFDFIIGNPPFIKDLTEKAKSINNKRLKDGLPNLPEHYSLSFLFLEQTTTLLSDNGNICLLFPADAFLLRRNEFQKYFYKKFNIHYILDFVPLRRILFKSASVGVVAICYNKSDNSNNNTLHVVIRRTKASENKLFFELDKYDFHYINLIEAIENNFIWKVHILGGSRRQFELIKKLNNFKKLGDFIKINKTHIKTGLSNKKNLPFLVIKRNILNYSLQNKIAWSISNLSEVFKSEVHKIYSIDNNLKYLKFIQNKINTENNLYKFFILNTSNRAGF